MLLLYLGSDLMGHSLHFSHILDGEEALFYLSVAEGQEMFRWAYFHRVLRFIAFPVLQLGCPEGVYIGGLVGLH